MSQGLRPLLWLAALFVIFSLLLSAWSPPSNCGGNTTALSQASQIALVARMAALTSPNDAFSFADASDEQREQLAMLSRSNWLRARFLVSLKPIQAEGNQPRRVLVASDTPYRNVPHQWIGMAPPTHAVVYSDGTSGLISPDEFAGLDRSAFRYLDKLFPSNSK